MIFRHVANIIQFQFEDIDEIIAFEEYLKKNGFVNVGDRRSPKEFFNYMFLKDQSEEAFNKQGKYCNIHIVETEDTKNYMYSLWDEDDYKMMTPSHQKRFIKDIKTYSSLTNFFEL
jgi:hypothetical protein